MGLNIAKIERRCGEFIFWDVGGQLVLRKIWEKYYGEADCIVFVIDGTDSIRFEEADEVIDKVFAGDDSLKDKPWLFLLNKADCPTYIGDQQITASLRLNEAAAKTKTTIAVSAYSKTGLAQAL